MLGSSRNLGEGIVKSHVSLPAGAQGAGGGGGAGGLWTDATVEMGCMCGQMSSKDDVGVPYTQVTPDKRHCTCTSF